MPIHVFDCSSAGSESELVWTGVRGVPIASQSVGSSGAERIAFSIKDVTSTDLGVYTCINFAADQNVSINIIDSKPYLLATQSIL